MSCNISAYPWYKFFQSLFFWQATWFLYFESHLSASEAVLLYVVYDLATIVFEVPSGYMSDRIGRKRTLIASAITFLAACMLLVMSFTFIQFAFANVLLGASMAFASGTDSALLFESLKAESREKELARHELKAWRAGFSALALSALAGGALALIDDVLPYVAMVLAAAAVLILTFRFKEPEHRKQSTHRDNLLDLASSLRQPTLLWLLLLTLTMYAMGHIPFVFGQPFMREALSTAGYAEQTPLVSGGVSFVMMAISVAVSLVALRLRNKLGLPRILLLAFGLQVALTIALASSNGLFVISLLFLRMVPDSLSEPFINARIQPLLGDGIRATYFSLQSLAGRVLFAIALSWAAARTASADELPYSELQPVLVVFAAFGVTAWAALALTARYTQVNDDQAELTSASTASPR